MNQNTIFIVLMLAMGLGLMTWIWNLRKENQELTAMAKREAAMAQEQMQKSEEAHRQVNLLVVQLHSKIDSLEYALLDCKDQQLLFDLKR